MKAAQRRSAPRSYSSFCLLSYPSHYTMGFLLILTLAHILVPFATPFAAAGSYPISTAGSSLTVTSPSATIEGLRKSKRAQKYTNPGPPSSTSSTSTSQRPNTNRHLARHMATTAGSQTPEKSSIRSFLDRVTPGRRSSNNKLQQRYAN